MQVNEQDEKTNPLVKIENFSVYFRTLEGRVQALDDINLTLDEGEILGIIGESGSGKSTTAISLLGLLAENAETSGKITYLDKDIIGSDDPSVSLKVRRKARRVLDERLMDIRWKEISMVFQGAMNAFNPVHTIRSQIKEVFELHGTFSDLSKFTLEDFLDITGLKSRAHELALGEIGKEKQSGLIILQKKLYEDLLSKRKAQLEVMSDKQKRDLLENIRMEGSCRKAGFSKKFLDAYPHELSGGMKQRGIIAMALALNPKVIIADEPTTGLDVITQAKIIKELKRLKDQKIVKSMIVISHDVGVVSQLANYIAVMYAGRIMEYGTPEQIFLHPNNPYTYALMRSYPSLDLIKRKIGGIPGSVPDMIEPPSGCFFASRCFMAEEICFKEKPEFKILDNNHKSLCHFDSISNEKYEAFQKSVVFIESQEQDSKGLLLEVKSLSKYYSVHSSLSTNLFGGSNKPVVHAVDNVNFSIPKGKIIGVVGESGSGKTTLGKLLINAISPTSGELLFQMNKAYFIGKEKENSSTMMDKNETEEKDSKVEGKSDYFDILKVSKASSLYGKFRKENQLIFQDPYDSINPKMSIFDIVAEPIYAQKTEILRRRQLSKDENKNGGTKEKHKKGLNIEKEVFDALSGANLYPVENYLERFPHELSGGERQRVSIARAITLNPSFLVADEPISMLDVSIRANIMNLLIKLKEERGITILYISHDIASARYISDYIIVMYLGQIVEFGKSEYIIKSPLHPYTKALISAVPSIDPSWVNSKLDIVGEIGSAINPTEGCRFYGRCIFRKDICKVEDPPIQSIEERYYLCHFGQDELTKSEDMEETRIFEDETL
jgi:peptide/nickel transport system ATP-binding protein